MPSLIKLISFILITSVLLGTTKVTRADISHRQAELELTVLGPDGQALSGAEILVELSNHAFRWGCAVTASQITNRESNHTKYLQKYFNSTTFGNAQKWGPFESRGPEASRALAVEALRLRAFNGEAGIRMRGHTTIWSQQAPNDITGATAEDADFLRERIYAHIPLYHETFRGVIDQFDFYNEPTNARALIEKLFPDSTFDYSNSGQGGGITQAEIEEIVHWMQLAQEADPEAELYINEYNVMNDWHENDIRVHVYKAFIDRLRDAGAPIAGIGVQGHIDRVRNYDHFKRRFEILSAPMEATANHPEGLPGLPIEVTELDIGINVGAAAQRPQIQAQIVEDMLRAAFESPSVQGVTIWGMDDSTHWFNNAVMFDDVSIPGTWQLKPSGQVYLDLVLGEWWNRETGQTDVNGRFSSTVFKGLQRVRLEHGGEVYWFTIDVSESRSVELQIPAERPEVDSYAAWRLQQPWADFTDGLPTSDANGNGKSNFLAYLFGTNPVISEALHYPLIVASPDTISLQFPFRLSAAEETGLSIRGSRSDHVFPALGLWSDLSYSLEAMEESEEFLWLDVQIPRPMFNSNYSNSYFFQLILRDQSHLEVPLIPLVSDQLQN